MLHNSVISLTGKEVYLLFHQTRREDRLLYTYMDMTWIGQVQLIFCKGMYRSFNLKIAIHTTQSNLRDLETSLYYKWCFQLRSFSVNFVLKMCRMPKWMLESVVITWMRWYWHYVVKLKVNMSWENESSSEVLCL